MFFVTFTIVKSKKCMSIKTTIRFELRTTKTDKEGKAPIRLVYQLKGQRKFYPTKLKCLPVNWSTKEQQAVFLNRKEAKKLVANTNYELLMTEAQVNDFNKDLSDCRQDIRDVEERFRLDNITYTLSMVLETLAAKKKPEARKEDAGKSVIAFIHHFVADTAVTHKTGTLKVYTGLAAHLSEYQKLSGEKAAFENMDIAFMRGFHSYLCSDRTVMRKGKQVEVKAMNNITAAKQLSTLKTLLNYARIHYKIEINQSYRDYAVARKDSNFEVITLTWDEFQTLYNLDLNNNKKLAQVRDIFCFSCTTGLRYSDLAQLKREHIRGNSIKMTAAKTGQKLDIPLNEYSATILEKYKEMHRPLPIISNQKTNDYLKELCELSGIDTPIEIVREYGIKKVATVYKKHELISIHVGRKTFTTLSLENGIAPQDVMSITGHTQWRSFKRYVDVSEKQKKAAMAKAWGTPKNHLKAV
jgi:integrase